METSRYHLLTMPPILMNLSAHSNPDISRLATVYELPDLAVFEISGADAVSFLQGQITNDIAGASPLNARLAGYCTPQGRLLATMVVSHAQPLADATPALRAIIKRDILAQTIKRLSMFVMRAKAKLSETPCLVRGITLAADKVAAFESKLGSPLPAAVWEKADTDAGTWVAAPSSGDPRWWLISGTDQATAVESLLQHCVAGPSENWHALDISEGLPWIEAATQDLFIPQTLNLDLIQGVSFTKGCYPGQEIVARSHYRGTVKRRMVTASIDPKSFAELSAEKLALVQQLTQPGVDVYDASREDQVCGRIINRAQIDSKISLLIESSFDAIDHNQLRSGAADGPSLQLELLPYPVRPELDGK